VAAPARGWGKSATRTSSPWSRSPGGSTPALSG